MTKEHIAFFQQQLKLLVNAWWQREMDDFHGNLDKGIDELNDLQHVSTELIEFHHTRIIKKDYRDNAKAPCLIFTNYMFHHSHQRS